uniref:Uncharacterized protein n=1 Tax=Oryctolagus cuniculus TaxID=9986 RepID=G1TYG0_RABIT
MPKKAGATSKGRSQSKDREAPLPPSGSVAVDPKGCVTIAIHAKPGAKQNARAGWHWRPDAPPLAESITLAARGRGISVASLEPWGRLSPVYQRQENQAGTALNLHISARYYMQKCVFTTILSIL